MGFLDVAMRSTVSLSIPLMAILAILESAIFARFPIFGLRPQVPFLVALAWGLLRDVEEGVVWAFVGGFFVDLFSILPIGMTSLVWMLVVLGVSWAAQTFPASRFFLPSLLAGLGTLISIPLMFVGLRLLGYELPVGMLTQLTPTAVLHAILILPIYWGLYAFTRAFRPRRVEL